MGKMVEAEIDNGIDVARTAVLRVFVRARKSYFPTRAIAPISPLPRSEQSPPVCCVLTYPS